MRHAVAAALIFVAVSAFGHDGEDHGAPPPPLAQAAEPRAAAATEEFEIVAALEGKHLVVYVDRFTSNEPVVKAKVEIEGAGLKGVAGETAPGTYALALATPLPPGKHPLAISVETGDGMDLLAATLDTSSSGTAEAHAHGWKQWGVWTLSGLLLATLLLFALWRQKRATKEIR